MLSFWSDTCHSCGLQAGGQVVIKSESELGFALKQSVINFRADAVMDVTQTVLEPGMRVQQAKVLTSFMAIAYSKSVIECNR